MGLHAELKAAADRRRTDRAALRISAQLLSERGQPLAIAVHDLSPFGLLFEADADLEDGAEVEFRLPGIGKVPATLAWGTGRLFGAAFDSPLSSAVVIAASASDAYLATAGAACSAAQAIPASGRPGWQVPLFGALAIAAWAMIAAPMLLI